MNEAMKSVEKYFISPWFSMLLYAFPAVYTFMADKVESMKFSSVWSGFLFTLWIFNYKFKQEPCFVRAANSSKLKQNK